MVFIELCYIKSDVPYHWATSEAFKMVLMAKDIELKHIKSTVPKRLTSVAFKGF